MPWCVRCDKNWTPTSLPRSGACPDCGDLVEGTPGVDHSVESFRPPWHFWIGAVAAVVYLGWRAVEGLMLLF